MKNTEKEKALNEIIRYCKVMKIDGEYPSTLSEWGDGVNWILERVIEFTEGLK